MITVEKELYLLLTQSAAMSAVKVYPRRIPQDTVFPAIDYATPSSVPVHSQSGFFRTMRMRFNVWGTNLDSMLDAYNALLGVLDGYNSGTMSAQYVGDLDSDDPETGLFRKVVDFFIQETRNGR